jgi:hypothetical protein
MDRANARSGLVGGERSIEWMRKYADSFCRWAGHRLGDPDTGVVSIPYFIIAARCFATAIDASMGLGNFTV